MKKNTVKYTSEKLICCRGRPAGDSAGDTDDERVSTSEYCSVLRQLFEVLLSLLVQLHWQQTVLLHMELYARDE